MAISPVADELKEEISTEDKGCGCFVMIFALVCLLLFLYYDYRLFDHYPFGYFFFNFR